MAEEISENVFFYFFLTNGLIFIKNGVETMVKAVWYGFYQNIQYTANTNDTYVS